MANPTLIEQLDPLFREQLTWEAMVRSGIEEAPLAIMRYEQAKRLCRSWPPSKFKTRLLMSMSVGASKARARLRDNDALADLYARRKELRSVAESMGLDNAAGQGFLKQVEALELAPRGRRSVLEPGPAVLSDEEELHREREALRALAAGLPPSLERFAASRGEPQFAPRERSPAAVNQRREFSALERRYRQAVQLVQQEQRERERQLAAVEAKLPVQEGSGPASTVMRGAAYQALTVAERVLHDHVLLAQAGREIPRASWHPQQHLPLHRRPGLR